jgi:hypothetical protein
MPESCARPRPSRMGISSLFSQGLMSQRWPALALRHCRCVREARSRDERPRVETVVPLRLRPARGLEKAQPAASRKKN